MKTLITFLVLTLSIHADFFSEKDKQQHIVFFSGISMITSVIAHDEYGINKYYASLIGFTIASLAGVGKEVYDDNFDTRDLGASVLGAGIGSVPVLVIYEF